MSRKKKSKVEAHTPSELSSAIPAELTASLAGIPLEIKLIILDILALESQKSLATVCQLAREWQSIAMPLLYETVTIWVPNDLETLAETVQSGRRPVSFYKTTVKTVCIVCAFLNKAWLDTVLAACSDITTLAIQHSTYSLATVIARHCEKLKKLCIPKTTLLDSKSKGLNSRIAALFKKTQITHLRLTLPGYGRFPKIDFRSLPLTHFNIHLANRDLLHSTPAEILDIVHQIFTLPPSVQYCIISVAYYHSQVYEHLAASHKDAVTSTYINHPAIVFMAELASYGNADWGSAENEVGREWYIPELVPCLLVNNNTWAYNWIKRPGENIWDIAERLITARRGTPISAS